MVLKLLSILRHSGLSMSYMSQYLEYGSSNLLRLRTSQMQNLSLFHVVSPEIVYHSRKVEKDTDRHWIIMGQPNYRMMMGHRYRHNIVIRTLSKQKTKHLGRKI